MTLSTEHREEFDRVVGAGLDPAQWERRENGAWVHKTAIVDLKSRIGEGSSYWGEIGDFERRVREVHKDSMHGRRYLAAVEFIRAWGPTRQFCRMV